MKKISFALLALSVAAISQAVQVNWTSGDLSAAKAAQADITGITAYYYVVSGATAAEIASTYDGTFSSADIVSAYLNSDGTLKDGVSYSASSGAVNATQTATSYSADWTQTLDSDAEEYVLAVYVAQSAFGGSYAMATLGHHTTGWSGDIGDEDPDNATTGLGEFTFAAETSGAWSPVPEPTTVALLALGLAAVGLKRKVA